MLNKLKAAGVFNGVVKAIAYAAAASLVIVSIAFAFIMLRPVDVVDNWKLETIGTDFKVGQEVTLISTLNKLMNVNGHSHRTLVCMNAGVEESFDLPDSTANRAAGPHATQVTIVIPDKIANLPRTCHININIDYVVYGIRHFPESTDSNDFTVSGQ